MSRSNVSPRLGGLLLAATLLALPAGTMAQDEDPAPPDGWMVRTDGGGHGGGELQFADMPPGFHITTGPSGIFYHPDLVARGNYRVESTIFLFDPGRRNEAFGIFIGGRDLDGDDQAYTYFLIRRDGGTLIKRRDGSGTSNIRGWTPHDAVLTWEEREEGGATAENVLAIEATDSELIFEVNGQEVHRIERAGQHSEGLVGVRVNHGLNLHVSSVDVTRGG